MNANFRKYGPLASLILSLVALLIAGVIYVLQRTFSLPIQISLGVVVLGLLLAIVFNPQQARQWVVGRQVRYASNALLVIIATLGILATLNYITHRYDLRWDLTEDQTHSLTKETQGVLDTFQQPVQAVGFFTSQTSSTSAKQMLDAYKYYAKGKFDYELVDPNSNVVRAQQAKITRDGTIVFTYAGRTEQVTSITEQDFTSALLRLANPGKRTVYFLTGEGEASLESSADVSLSLLNTSLTSKNYTVSSLNLLSDHKVPDDAKAVVIAGPQVNLSSDEVNALKTYLDAGGGLVYLSLPPYFTKAGDQVNPLDQYLHDNWGFDFGNNIIVDPNVNPPSVTYSKTLADHPITNKISYSVFFPSAHSISPSSKLPDNIDQTVLVKTSTNAWGETDLTTLGNGSVSFDSAKDLAGPVSVAIAATDKKSTAKVVAIGDLNFTADKSFQSYGNSEFIINSIDWAAKQDNLLNLTPKNQTTRSLIPPQDLTIGLIFLVIVILIPGLVIAMGIITWIQRRRRG